MGFCDRPLLPHPSVTLPSALLEATKLAMGAHEVYERIRGRRLVLGRCRVDEQTPILHHCLALLLHPGVWHLHTLTRVSLMLMQEAFLASFGSPVLHACTASPAYKGMC